MASIECISDSQVGQELEKSLLLAAFEGQLVQIDFAALVPQTELRDEFGLPLFHRGEVGVANDVVRVHSVLGRRNRLAHVVQDRRRRQVRFPFLFEFMQGF